MEPTPAHSRCSRRPQRVDEILKEFMDFEVRQTSVGIMAYRALRTSVADANKEAVVSALSRLTSRRTLRLVRATYTNLVSTGNLRLIRNSALRDRIVKYYDAGRSRLGPAVAAVGARTRI